ncbi:MAG: hypothetical protein ACLUJG_18400 [Lawsonibacter sp.]
MLASTAVMAAVRLAALGTAWIGPSARRQERELLSLGALCARGRRGRLLRR